MDDNNSVPSSGELKPITNSPDDGMDVVLYGYGPDGKLIALGDVTSGRGGLREYTGNFALASMGWFGIAPPR